MKNKRKRIFHLHLLKYKLDIVVLLFTHPDIMFSFLNSAFGKQRFLASHYDQVVYVRSTIPSTRNLKTKRI